MSRVVLVLALAHVAAAKVERPVTGWRYDSASPAQTRATCTIGHLEPRCTSQFWDVVSLQCGKTGWQSPINAPFKAARAHPTATPAGLVLGGGIPVPGRLPKPACQQAFFITNQHTTEVNFDMSHVEEWTRPPCHAIEVAGVLETEHERQRRCEEAGADGATSDILLTCPKPLTQRMWGNSAADASLYGKKCIRKCTRPTAGMRVPPDPLYPLPYDVRTGSTGQLLRYSWHSPSEHMMDGGYFPMEMHLVHGKPPKAKGGEADPELGPYTIFAIFVTASKDLESRCVGGGATPAEKLDCTRANFFDAIQRNMPTLADKCGTPGNYACVAVKEEEVGALDPTTGKRSLTCWTYHPAGTPCPKHHEEVAKWAKYVDTQFVPTLPMGLDPYAINFMPPMLFFYFYVGSLTRPPCSVSVTWVLAPTPITIFDKSLVYYKSVIAQMPTNNLRKAVWTPLMWNPMANFGWFTWDNAMQINTNNRLEQALAGVSAAGSAPRQFYRIGELSTSIITPLKYLDSAPGYSSGNTAGQSLDSGMSSSMWGEKDLFSSGMSMGSMGSGSFGFYIANWKWIALSVICCCCCGLCYLICNGDEIWKARTAAQKGKADKAKLAADKLAKPAADKAEKPAKAEAEPLLPLLSPMMPAVTGVPVMQSYPQYAQTMPMTTAMPMSGGYGYPGTVV